MKRADAAVVVVAAVSVAVVAVAVVAVAELDLELCAWFVWNHRVTYPWGPYQSLTLANASPHRNDFQHL